MGDRPPWKAAIARIHSSLKDLNMISTMNTRSMVALGIFAVGVALVAPYAIKEAGERMALTDRASGLETELARIQHEEQVSNARRELAERRYEQGCTLLVKDQRFVALFEGAIVTDRVTGKPVVDGMPVCDIYGNTAETEAGRLINLASTGNQDVIDAGVARAQAAQRWLGTGEDSASE
jgi:hypothetical protein